MSVTVDCGEGKHDPSESVAADAISDPSGSDEVQA